MIVPLRANVPVPASIAENAPITDPREQVRLAGVLLVAQARTAKDPHGRELGRQALHQRLAKANKQLARTGPVYSWANLPGRKQKEYR
ncbi:hypothetical protein [Streptomyces sp. NPDC059916]|uniref:hypothetical protein n=1 Tax=Streptomyces sp. NPDC059916 TaxID=3347001 RepID=UPI0036AC6382